MCGMAEQRGARHGEDYRTGNIVNDLCRYLQFFLCTCIESYFTHTTIHYYSCEKEQVVWGGTRRDGRRKEEESTLRRRPHCPPSSAPSSVRRGGGVACSWALLLRPLFLGTVSLSLLGPAGAAVAVTAAMRGEISLPSKRRRGAEEVPPPPRLPLLPAVSFTCWCWCARRCASRKCLKAAASK